MKHWRILADDLTGALDSAAAFSGAGPVPVFLGQPSPQAAAVQVVATGSRDVPAAALPDLLGPCLSWFTAGGKAFTFKKIDSLLRGNTFAEIAWLAHAGRFDGVVFAPAFPAQGRFTHQGRHWVAAPHQPDAPRTHEHRQPLLEALADAGLRAHIPASAELSLDGGGHVVVPDILGDDDLHRLAALSTRPQAQHWLWCGSAGLAWALARHWQLAPTAPQAVPAPLAGLTLLVTASRHPVLRAQLKQLRPGLLQDTAHHASAPSTPAKSRTVLLDLAETNTLPPARAQSRLAQLAHDVVSGQPRPDMLVVVGGDTLLALCQASGAQSLLALANPRPGWGCARITGGRWDGVICYARSGAFGAPDDLSNLLEQLTHKEHAT